MLRITGNLQGVEYNNQNVSATELAQKFNVPQLRPDRSLELELHPDLIGRSLAGEKTMPVSQGRRPVFSGSDAAGRTFSIRYYEGERPGTGSNPPTFLPESLRNKGSVWAFNSQNYEQFVFWYLHPDCADSPFHRSGTKPKWQYRNLDKQANEMVARNQRMLSVMAEIASVAEPILRVKSNGLQVNGNVLYLPANPTAEMMRAQLLEAYRVHGEAFIESWQSNETFARGLAGEALSRGILREEISGGEQRVVVVRGERLGVKVVSTRQGNARQLLDQYVLDNFDDWGNYLAKELNLVETAPTAPKVIESRPVNELGTPELAELCFQNEIVSFDRTSRFVSLLGVGDKPSKRLVKIEPGDDKNWKTRLAEFLTSNEEVKAEIVSRL